MVKMLAPVFYLAGNDMDDSGVALNNTFYLQQPALDDGCAVLFEYPGPDHHIDIVGLILKGQKQHA